MSLYKCQDFYLHFALQLVDTILWDSYKSLKVYWHVTFAISKLYLFVLVSAFVIVFELLDQSNKNCAFAIPVTRVIMLCINNACKYYYPDN